MKFMVSSPVISWQIDGENVETVSDFIFLGSKITADSDCSHKIKRHLLLGRISSVTQSCLTLWDPMDCSTPFFPVHHQLPELTQTHVHLILCRPLLLLPSVYPSIRVFSSESVLCIRWPKYWSFSFSISPSNEYEYELINIRTVVVYFIVDYLFDPLEVKPYEGSNLFVLLNNVSSGCITLAGILRKYLLN